MKLKQGIFAKASVILIVLLILTALVKFSFADTQTHNTVPSANANFISDVQDFLEQEAAERDQQRIYNVILSGGVGATDASLTHTIPACVGYPNGYYVSQGAKSHTYTDDTTTGVYLRDSDTRTVTVSGASVTYDEHFVFVEFSGAATLPEVPTGCLALMEVDTNDPGTSAIYTVTDLRSGEIPLKAFASFSAAVDAADNRTIVIADRVRLSSNKTVPAEVTLRFLNGAIMLIDSGVTLTINGSIIAGNYQIFSGSGTVDVSGMTGGLLLPDWDSGQISGTTPQIDGENVLFDSITFVANSNGNPNVSDTLVTISSVVIEGSWESIGPTGSGAANTWTALDSAPSGVDWIRLHGHVYGSDGSASSDLGIHVYIRATGSSEAAGDENKVFHTGDFSDSSGNANGSDTGEITVPVDSDIRFDAYWAGNFTNETVIFRLVGWGYNDN